MDLDRWLETFRGPLVGLLASWGASWGDAEELAQDTFAEAYLSFDRFQGDPESNTAVGAWLRGIAFRLLSSSRRKLRRLGQSLQDSAAQIAPQEAPEDERLSTLRQAMERLPGKLRTVLWMVYLDDCRVGDAAALLGETEKAVENRLRRARSELYRLLTADAMTEDGRLKR